MEPDGHVVVSIGKIIPVGGPKQTVAGRRKRFRTALDAILKANGWERARANTYRPPNSTCPRRGAVGRSGNHPRDRRFIVETAPLIAAWIIG